MDLKCRICREPWDNDCIHEEVAERNDQSINTSRDRATYDQVYREFTRFGCGALVVAFTGKVSINDFGNLALTRCPDGPSRGDAGSTELMSAIYDVAGDDTDAAASFLEDAEMFGLL